MSLFGATSSQQPGQSGGMFSGLSSNTNTQQPSGGLFGNTNTNTNAGQTGGSGGGIFGNAGGSGGGLFGSTNTNTQNQGQNQGGGLFGNTNNQQQPNGGGLFGNMNTNTQQQQQPTGGLFGNTNTNTTNGQSSTGGLFGNASANTNTSTNQPPALTLNTGGGGLFGNTNTSTSTSTNPLFGNKPPGSIFGNTSTTAPSSNTANPNPNPLFGGGSLFGSTNTNTNNPQQQQTGGLFGSTNNQQQQQPTGGLFGSTSTQQQQPAGSLFGQPQQTQQQKPTSSLFGSTNTNPLTLSSLNPPTNNQGSGLFGSTLSSTNNLSSTARGSGGEVDAQTQFAALTKRIEGIAGAWNAQNPECRFQHYFYNLVDPAQVNLYGRPPNATNEPLWQKAVRENPDRTCLVPVVAVGFDDLRQRVDAQSQQASAHQEKLKELKTRIEALSQRHAISNSTRLSRASTTQTQITHRLLKLIQHLHLLIPALRSSAIRPEEEALRVQLEEIEEELKRGRLRGKLNELWAVVGALLNGAKGGRERGGTEWTVVDENGLAQIAQILSEQQAGLQHLTKLLQRDAKDLAVIQGKSWDGDGTESFFSSTSTLRASTLR